MNLQPTDILLRQSGGRESIWLSQRLVAEVCNVDENYLKVARIRYKKTVRACDIAKAKDFMPDSGKSWRWSKQYGQFYYCLDNIPDRQPVHYRSLFGDSEALLDMYRAVCKSKDLSSLEIRFKRFLKDNFRNYLEFYTDTDEIQRVALAKACATLEFILNEKEDYPGTKNKLYKDIAPILKVNDIRYFPHNPLRIKEKVDILEDTDHAIIEIIRLPRVGNSNAEVYNDPVVFSWAMQLRMMSQNYTDAHIARTIWDACDRTGRKKPTRRWFGMQIFEQAKTKFLTGEKRFGSSRKAQIFKDRIPFADALYAGDTWQIDSTRVNIIAHRSADGSDRYLNVIAVRDVMSGDILGHAFDYSENSDAYLRALKMAVQTSGYLPYEIVTDRFPGHNTDLIKRLFARMEALGVNIQITHNANGKAGIERWFGTFQSVILMGSKYYYGEGIQSRRLTAHRSPEYLKEVKKEAKKAGFDLVAAYTECENLVEQFRDIKYSVYSRKHENLHKSPKELHQESEKPFVNWISAMQTSMLFDRKTEITLSGKGSFIKEIAGVKITYKVSPEYYDVISSYHGKKVVVSYDLDDLSQVYLWEEHDMLLKSLCPADRFEDIMIHGPKKELGRLSQAKARERQIDAMKEQELSDIINVGEDSMMMGIYTNKTKVNEYEDSYWNHEEIQVPLKKASGDGLSPEDIENAVLNNIHDEF
ncbi:Mu transposase C-terminal domain-containing protein [Elizabethkingia sp. HX WHF]|uniref:Mu transposase C-terminal domain-containing protein n=1 Tax=Elizabethkingia sp. HX WHF TaxID=3003190 RepID=UPI002A23EB0F|nr:Mu transposase C-terminal domain-containing protein [Elizabethkingia sp. HX WHF]MDX8566310.1 Mu transposase C-terminal domain-containing protein [Elizabethkingia sp. HX WHF]